MPKISEYGEATVINGSSSVLGVQDGSTKRFPLSLFYTSDNPPPLEFAALLDVPNSYESQAGKLVKVRADELGLEFGDPPASTLLALTDTPESYTGYANKVLTVTGAEDGIEFKDASILSSETAPSNPTDGQLWLDTTVGYSSNLGYVDLTSASSDYLLKRGETATITYSGATSVPLHIATQEGVYEIELSGDMSITATNNNVVLLQPNNTAHSSGMFGYQTYTGSDSSSGDGAGTITDFELGNGVVLSLSTTIHTKTTAKTVTTLVIEKRSSTSYSMIKRQYWNDTTTVWSSLGTIAFPFAQSGTIAVRRIS